MDDRETWKHEVFKRSIAQLRANACIGFVVNRIVKVTKRHGVKCYQSARFPRFFLLITNETKE